MKFEYQMSEAMAKTILKDRKKENPQDFLIQFVNEQLGIKGTCIKVSTI